jgi:cytochrome oxidase Cu insertion factor (SCO1/SenC/PrrC family)
MGGYYRLLLGLSQRFTPQSQRSSNTIMKRPAASFPRTAIFGLLTLLIALALGAYVLMSSTISNTGQGVALVGGPFSMLNQKGETVTDKTYLGKPMLLFFGFTFCPDICPTELQVMAAALEELGSAGSDIQPIFVSVDPARDTPEVMAGYIANFGPRFIGLTGSATQVADMAGQYRVYYAKQDNAQDPKNYLMDHSSIIYLMGADGKFLKHFSYSTDAKALATGLRQALGR